MFSKYALLKNQVLENFSHFFVVIFSLAFIGHLYQHLLLSSFILNHTSRLSYCKILFFLGCILKFPTWQDFPIFLFFFFFFFFSLALTFAQIALLGFQPSGLFFFFFWPQVLPRPPFSVFSLAGFFLFFFFFFSFFFSFFFLVFHLLIE